MYKFWDGVRGGFVVACLANGLVRAEDMARVTNTEEIRQLLKEMRTCCKRLENLLVIPFDPDLIYSWADNDKLAIWLKAIARSESNFNPRAVSPAGAQGLMQLMPAIQRVFDVRDPFDPEESVRAAEGLLEEELERFGSMRLALAAYNAGSPTVMKAMRKAGIGASFQEIKAFLPEETREYVPKVEGFVELYKIKDKVLLTA